MKIPKCNDKCMNAERIEDLCEAHLAYHEQVMAEWHSIECEAMMSYAEFKDTY